MRIQISAWVVLLLLLPLLLAGAACTDRAVVASDGSSVIKRDGRPFPAPDLRPQRPDRGLPPPPDTWWPPTPDQALPSYQHSIMIVAGDSTYLPSKGAPSYPFARVGTLLVLSSSNSPAYNPDFIDAPKPPNCVGYRWKKGGAPNFFVSRAGTINVFGYKKTTVGGVSLPATIGCTEGKVGPNNIYGYSCKPLGLAVPIGSSWLTGTKLGANALGGADVPAFSTGGVLPPGAPPVLSPSSDLNHIDPTKSLWLTWDKTHKSALMAIAFQARLKDGSEQAEVWCTGLTLLGSKKIPPGALALFPKPKSASNPLLILTQIIGTNVTGKTQSWGSYTLLAGLGVFGVSCRTPTGSCW